MEGDANACSKRFWHARPNHPDPLERRVTIRPPHIQVTNMKPLFLTLTACMTACFQPLAWAGASGHVVSGGTFIPISDGTTDHGCIDVSKNLVSVQLVGAQVEGDQTWWDKLLHKHQALGVKFDVIITDQGSHTFDFPRAKQLSTAGQSSDIALLPIGYPVMSKYALKAKDGSAFLNMELDLYFIEVDTASPAFQTMEALVEFSKTLPLPPNPFETGVSYFGDFANKIEHQSLKNGASPDPDASVTFDLASDSNQASATVCPSTGLRGGVQAVVFDYEGTTAGNFVKTDDVGNYCYWYDATSRRVLFDVKPVGSGQCSTLRTSAARALDNPLMTFVISPWPMPGTPQPAPALVATTLKPVPHLATISEQDVTGFATKVFRNDAAARANVHPAFVKVLLDYLSRPGVNPKHLVSFQSQLTSEDAATAIALRRCAVVGIDAQHCD